MKLTFCISLGDVDKKYAYKLIDRLGKQKEQNFNVVIQDNSTSDLDDKLSKESETRSNFTYDKFPASGLSESRNRCALIAQSEYLHFLDDDIFIDEDFSHQVLKSISSNPKASIIGGKVKPIWESERPQWVTENIAEMMSVLDFGDSLLKFGEGRFNWLAGANFIIKKTAFLYFSGFNLRLGRSSSDESLMSNEENQLLNKLVKDGGLALYDPNIVVHHYIKDSKVTRQWIMKRVAWQAVSDYMSGDNWYNVEEGEDVLIKDCCFSIYNKEDYNLENYLSKIKFLCYKMLEGKM